MADGRARPYLCDEARSRDAEARFSIGYPLASITFTSGVIISHHVQLHMLGTTSMIVTVLSPTVMVCLAPVARRKVSGG